MKKLLAILLAMMCTFCIVSYADLGPKPSITVNFKNVPKETCYVALLSESNTTGPRWAYSGDESSKDLGELDEAIWQAFVDYEDPDGFFYLQNGELLTDDTYKWGYYPPAVFKVLLYFPETGAFLSSGICERKAFDTYYTVDLAGVSISNNADLENVKYDNENSTDERLDAEENKFSGTGIVKFIIRVILTVAIELIIAVFFGIKSKKGIIFIILSNIVTQCFLNAFLSLFFVGSMEKLYFLGLEFAVFAIEALLYATLLKKFENKNKKAVYYVIYAATANVCSCGLGILLGILLPQIM